MLEFIATFVLVYVIFATAVDRAGAAKVRGGESERETDRQVKLTVKMSDTRETSTQAKTILSAAAFALQSSSRVDLFLLSRTNKNTLENKQKHFREQTKTL